MRRSLLALGALLTACPAPHTPEPAPRDAGVASAALTGARVWRLAEDGRVVPWFDRDRPPRIRTTPEASDAWSARWDGAPAPTRVTPDGLEVVGTRGEHTLEVRYHDAPVAEWRVGWEIPPDDTLAVSTARARREAGDEASGLATLDAAMTSTEGWNATWAAVERARWIRDRGDADRAREAQRVAGDVATRAGLVTEAAARYRAAAYYAITRGQYDEAFGLLLRARGVARGADGAVGLGRVTYLSGVLSLHLGRYRAAEVELRRALELAREAGEANDVTLFADYLAVLFALLGRYDDALETMEAHPPADDAPAHVRASDLANRGWALAHRALAHGGDLDPARRLFDLARAIYLEDHRVQLAANQTGFLAWLALESNDLARAEAELDALPDDKELSHARWRARLLRADLERAKGDVTRAIAIANAVIEDHAKERDGAATEESISAYAILAEAHAARGDLERAIEAQRRAWSEVLRVGRSTWLRSAMGSYLRRGHAVRSDLIELLVRHGEIREAFEVADTGRAEVYREVAASAHPEASSEAWAEHVARRAQLLAALERGCRADADACRRDLDRRIDAWSEAAARIYDPPKRAHHARTDLTAVRRALDEGQAVLLAESTSSGTLRTFWLDAHGVKTATTAALASPWRAEIAAARHVFVVPHDPVAHLSGVSWSVLPHAGWLAEPHAERHADQRWVLGDPTTEAEQAWVAAELEADRLVGDAAPRALLARVRDAELLHFAGHGRIVGADPWNTHLRLGPKRVIAAEDLLVARPAVRLAVLNGCETGADAEANAIGLPQLLLMSGTRSVLATVRPVRQEAAFRFVRRFYEAGGARSPGPAFLRAAQASKSAGDDDASAYRLWGLP